MNCPGAKCPGARYPGANCPGARCPGVNYEYPGARCPGVYYPGRQTPGNEWWTDIPNRRYPKSLVDLRGLLRRWTLAPRPDDGDILADPLVALEARLIGTLCHIPKPWIVMLFLCKSDLLHQQLELTGVGSSGTCKIFHKAPSTSD